MFSQTCEYAIRAATYIAIRSDDGLLLAKDIAEHTHVPPKYLQKVLRDLVKGGVLTSSRGIGGGFKLSRSPRSICLADVVAPFNDEARVTACPFGNLQCGDAEPCPAHDRWLRVLSAYDKFLKSTTLAQLMRGPAAGQAKKKAKKPARNSRRVKKRA